MVQSEISHLKKRQMHLGAATVGRRLEAEVSAVRRWPPARAHLKQLSVCSQCRNSVTGGKVTGGRMGKAEVLGLWVSVGHASKRTKFDSMSMITMNCPDCKELARYIPKRMQMDLKMEQISLKTLIDKHIQITVPFTAKYLWD